MGRRKGREGATAEIRRSRATEKVDDDGDESSGNIAGEEGDEEASGRFFACYLLTSLSPRFKGHTYIGFTVNPRRRIRQHNGEITSGAWKTKRKRPWEMVLCIYGFPTNVAALQFEWAWQHPVESLAVRQAAATFKSLSGLANKIKLAYTMLNLPSWQRLNLTVNYFSTKYMKHAVGCPILPEQMRVKVCTIEELPSCTRSSSSSDEHDELQYADDDSQKSGGSQESTKNELAHAQKHNDDDVVFVQDDVECGLGDWAGQGGGCTKRTILERMKNSQLCDQNSVQETPFYFSSSNKMTANADDIGTFCLSDELLGQPRIRGAEEKEVHKQSLQTSGCHVRASSLSVSSCNNMITTAEDREIFGSPDAFLRERENEVNKHSFQRNGCSVGAPSLFLSSNNKVATIAEEKERIFGLLDSIDEHTLLQKQQNPGTSLPSKIPFIMSSEVEVIDVFTPPMSSEVEVIDVFTPPMSSRSKKRRRSKAEIIDLTMSPLLV